MIDLRYPGQQSSLRIAYSRDPGVIVAGFEAAHQALYGHLQTGSIPQIAALRVTGSIAAPALAMSPPPRTAIAAPVPHTHRSVWIEGLGVADEVPVYRGSDLHPGHCLAGPFIVEEKTTTILVNPGDSLSVDASDLIVIAIAARVEAMHKTRHYEVAL
jgi:N-methylhydantoinase A